MLTEPTNEERAERARKCLELHNQLMDDVGATPEDAVHCLIADLQHFMDTVDGDFDNMLNLAEMHYDEEKES